MRMWNNKHWIEYLLSLKNIWDRLTFRHGFLNWHILRYYFEKKVNGKYRKCSISIVRVAK